MPDDNKHRSCRVQIKNKYIKPDGFDPVTNTIYEFYGDFWHGNPSIYCPDDFNNVNGKTFGQLYSKTIDRENLILSLGYNLITIWESDWNEQSIS